uniref:Uncharacterized protein n=1 Tax=Oryza sativa subsp. japonica TaxID=39947 RepID=Q5Z9Z2_ORYSJ|nr:hypothetical protein [Oryza sativa Japonica Group]
MWNVARLLPPPLVVARIAYSHSNSRGESLTRSLTSRKGSQDEGQDMLLIGGRDGPQGVNDGLRLIVIQV